MSIKNLWRNHFLRKMYLHAKQAEYLKRVGAGTNDRLIVFLVPGYDRVNGGILSIISLAEETAKLVSYHNADVFVCTVPDDPPLNRFSKFKNSTHLVDLALLLSRISNNGRILIHIPEIFVSRFSRKIQQLTGTYPHLTWQFNILLQNIDLIPEKRFVECLAAHGRTTCTTAHKAYSNQETEKQIGCPVYHFSTYVSPEKYIRKSYPEKDNLIVVSPDKHPRRKEILETLKSRMNGYTFKTIKNMTYEEYKRTIASAKFSLTLGEGLDGYFVESVFSGGIGCAIYNDRFFTDDLSRMPFVYRTWEELLEQFPGDAEATDSRSSYQQAYLQQFDALSALYSHDNYVNNLIAFYKQCNYPAEPLTPA